MRAKVLPLPRVDISSQFYRWLDLSKATETQLESLVKACAPATFGADNKDILDLSYRKAGKMDATDFMAHFHPELSGLSEFARGQLLEGDEDLKGMRTELYNSTFMVSHGTLQLTTPSEVSSSYKGLFF